MHTLIRIKTLLVLDKLKLMDLRLGVGMVEIIKTEINKTQQRTNPVKSCVLIVKPNLWLSISIPNGIRSRYAPAGAGTP